MWWQEGWVWIVAGIGLGVLEVLAPGYVFLGFAVGAVIVGAGLWIGLLGGSPAVLALVFALVSLVAWWVLRRIFGLRKGQVKIWHDDINN
jgi:membrane protein implicated in regulation of membrane protease activity